jgi:hypothetical protein
MYLFLLDNGHSHSIDLNTEWAGDHTHEYIDVHLLKSQFQSNMHLTNLGIKPSNVGPNCGWDTMGKTQFCRKTFSIDKHQHLVKGITSNSHASLAYTGGNQPFDNRPVYGIVQFIIYIQN